MSKIKFEIQNNEEIILNATNNGKKPIHFIAIGGIGMSGLAKCLLELGFKVSGSDLKDNPNMLSITELGGTVFVGHSKHNVGDAALVVVSSAIKEDNPELIEAKEKGLPILHRSHILEALMSGLGLDGTQISIGVSGTHGKTTTSGMLSIVLEKAGLSPSIVVGGQLPTLKTNAKLGGGKFFVSELDESDGSIAIYRPNITVLTNLERDHLDHFSAGMEDLLTTFKDYVSNLIVGSKLIVNADCKGNRALINQVDHKGVILYSCDLESPLHNKAAYRAEDIVLSGFGSTAKIYRQDMLLGELQLSVPGIHNISNALATIAVCLEQGLDFETITKALNQFTGMRRRFQVLSKNKGITIVDDYAHHPTEVIATLQGAKSIVDAGFAKRIVVVFQPHRFTRLAGLWTDFLESFKDCDVLFATDVYAAGETPRGSYTIEEFCKTINHGNAQHIPGCIEEVANKVVGTLREGDIVLTLGAGNITALGNILVDKLSSKKA